MIFKSGNVLHLPKKRNTEFSPPVHLRKQRFKHKEPVKNFSEKPDKRAVDNRHDYRSDAYAAKSAEKSKRQHARGRKAAKIKTCFEFRQRNVEPAAQHFNKKIIHLRIKVDFVERSDRKRTEQHAARKQKQAHRQSKTSRCCHCGIECRHNAAPCVKHKAVDYARHERKQVHRLYAAHQNAENRKQQCLNNVFRPSESQERKFKAENIRRSNDHRNAEIRRRRHCNGK